MLHTVDVLSSAIVSWFEAAHRFGKSTDLLTRTFDLTSAYRQVALSSEGRRCSLICAFDPTERRGRLFRCNVLPFGAVRSVHSFLRLARALWFVAAKGCNIVWTSFYDDFITISSNELARNTEQCIVSLFKLTGWAFNSQNPARNAILLANAAKRLVCSSILNNQLKVWLAS